MFSPVPEILDQLRARRMVILTDDEDRENEGDLVLPAQFATPEAINFMLSAARGYLCLSLTPEDCDRLALHPQAPTNTSVRGTPMTVSIDGHPRHGFTTGVSARERANTIRLAIDPASRPDDFVRPGHVNPLRSREGGVLVRTGQTEGSVDLCRLAGLYPAAAIIEVMREDGEMARRADLEALCRKHGLKMCSVAQVIRHRLGRESLVRRAEPREGAAVPTPYGEFRAVLFESLVDPLPHVALTFGGVGELDEAGRVREQESPVLVRVHRHDLLGDLFGAAPGGIPSSGDVLRASIRAIATEGRGVLLYLRPQGAAGPAGGELEHRLHTVRGERHADVPDLSAQLPWPASDREIGIGSQVLRRLGVSKLRLLTNHPREWPGLEAFGIEIVEHVAVCGTS